MDHLTPAGRLERQLAELLERQGRLKDDSGRATLAREIALLRDQLSEVYSAGRDWR